MVETENLPTAVKYEPQPYWGCPKCGGNCYSAINIKEHERDSSVEYVYRCIGMQPHKMMVEFPGCGTLFTLPPEAIEEHRNELIAEGFEIDDSGT